MDESERVPLVDARAARRHRFVPAVPRRVQRAGGSGDVDEALRPVAMVGDRLEVEIEEAVLNGGAEDSLTAVRDADLVDGGAPAELRADGHLAEALALLGHLEQGNRVERVRQGGVDRWQIRSHN